VRLESSPETYKEFLKAYEDEAYEDEAPKAPHLVGEDFWQRIHDKLKVIFKDHPDLLRDFELLPVPGKKPSGSAGEAPVQDSSKQKE
jgi:hypothetical protein